MEEDTFFIHKLTPQRRHCRESSGSVAITVFQIPSEHGIAKLCTVPRPRHVVNVLILNRKHVASQAPVCVCSMHVSKVLTRFKYPSLLYLACQEIAFQRQQHSTWLSVKRTTVIGLHLSGPGLSMDRCHAFGMWHDMTWQLVMTTSESFRKEVAEKLVAWLLESTAISIPYLGRFSNQFFHIFPNVLVTWLKRSLFNMLGTSKERSRRLGVGICCLDNLRLPSNTRTLVHQCPGGHAIYAPVFRNRKANPNMDVFFVTSHSQADKFTGAMWIQLVRRYDMVRSCAQDVVVKSLDARVQLGAGWR